VSELKPILYVDDEENNLTVFEAAFEDWYDVHTALSGADALRIMGERPIHVLVTDMRMPGMNGVELLERVLPDHPDVTRIVLTGYTDVDSIIRAINQGQVHQYVTKPWDERELRMIIDRSLERYAAAQKEIELTAQLDAAIRSEESIRQVFQRFVPPEVTDELLKEVTDEGPSARAQAKEVTLLFVDIRGFTTLCSAHAPPLILDLLNEYFARMTAIIGQNSGTVNQFLGDAILAVFGAPMEVVDSTRRAIRAALQIVGAIESFNERALELVGEPLRIGIGLQRGLASMGVVTAQDRSFYCAAGVPIYQVMQVENHSRSHENSVIITEDVLVAAGDGVETVPHGEARFGESDRGVPLHRVTGLR
jgi:class 3 adenylate cyclase